MFVCRYINENGVFFGSGNTLDEAAHDMMDSEDTEFLLPDFADFGAFEFFQLVDTRVDTAVTWKLEEDYQESWED